MAPPRPRCCLNVGVTGHRLNRVSQRELDDATPDLQRILRSLAATATALCSSERAGYADAPPELRVLSGLAEGSDRHVAAIAQRQGYALHALLPFRRDDYVLDFETEPSRADYRSLLAGCSSCRASAATPSAATKWSAARSSPTRTS